MARYPVDSPISISTRFGAKDSNAYFGYHSGIDFPKAEGNAVNAPADATVWWAGNNKTGGNMVILYDGQYYHRLMHNKELKVSAGKSVKEGELVAVSGWTGLVSPANSDGAHVHWDVAIEMLVNLRPSSFSKFVNPNDWVSYMNSKGENVATKTNLNTARLNAFFMGGRLNALDGSQDNDLKQNHVGGDLESDMWAWYNSAEGQRWKARIEALPRLEAAASQSNDQKLKNLITNLEKELSDIENELNKAK